MSRKPGPKTEVAASMERATYTVDEMTRRRLRVLGEGNESAGVRIAARMAFDRYQLEADAKAPDEGPDVELSGQARRRPSPSNTQLPAAAAAPLERVVRALDEDRDEAELQTR